MSNDKLPSGAFLPSSNRAAAVLKSYARVTPIDVKRLYQQQECDPSCIATIHLTGCIAQNSSLAVVSIAFGIDDPSH